MPNSLLDKKGFEYIKQQMQRRNNAYNVYQKYYEGIQYDDAAIRRAYALYAGVQEFYTLISRAVDVDVQLVPGGWQVTPPEAQPTVDKVLEWSNWRLNGNLYVHYGALYGDVYLLVSNDSTNPVIQPVNPKSVYLDDQVGIIIRNTVDRSGDQMEKAWLYTDEVWQYYIDGVLLQSMRHNLGFIPMVYCQNKDVGANMGLNSFHNVISEVNAVNEMATILQEAIMRALNAIKVVSGAQATELQAGPDQTYFLPMGASMDIKTGLVDVTGTLDFLKDIKQEVKQALPEFVFDSLRAPGLERPNSADALRLYAQELMTKIDRMRDSYDKALETAVNYSVYAARQVDLRPGDLPANWHFDKDRDIIKYTTPTEAVTQGE
jgi:hypothetical protein